MYLVFSVFTSRPTSLLASIKVCVFFFIDPVTYLRNEAVSSLEYIASDSRVINVLLHVVPLLGNDREISKYTTAVTE
jgi:hypothetical protein